MMVATEQRRKAAQLVLDFYKGRITNDQMEAAWPHAPEDPALNKVFLTTWFLYSDFHEHYIEPSIRRNYAWAKAIHRCLIFLISGLEYEWYGWPDPGTPLDRLIRMISRRRREINEAGVDSVWPFYRREDYRRAWKQSRN